jgi:hypothetical protein
MFIPHALAYQVLIRHHVLAVFADATEAAAYAADQAGDYAQIVAVEFWPAGSWDHHHRHRGGEQTGAGDSRRSELLTGPLTTPVAAAQRAHAQMLRGCLGAGITVTYDPHGLTTWHCARCAGRIR